MTHEDLEELFEEFFKLRSIEVNDSKEGDLKEAVIDFNSQKDFYRFNDYFNGCVLYGL